MPVMRPRRSAAFALLALGFISLFSLSCNAQAALLMEQPYGFFGTLNPTGHDAVYFARICAETPVKLRRCQAGEMGSVIARYSDISGYDWVAMPLIPYLYSVEDPETVPDRVDRDTVNRLRDAYHEEHLMSLGENLRKGGFLHGGWSELVGVAYERKMYAFTFVTTEEQDDDFIAMMNDSSNRSRFHLLFNNCADFSRVVLDTYFPGKFHRSAFPDAGMTTPKQITSKLLSYSKNHPEIELQVYEIPQIPGNRRPSRSNRNISEALITTGYVIPIAILNPWVAGGLFVDFLAHRNANLIPKDHRVLAPDSLSVLTSPAEPAQDFVSASTQIHSTVTSGSEEIPPTSRDTTGMKEILATHE